MPKNKLQNKIQIKKSKFTWEQSCQPHLETIVPVSLGNNRVSVTWEQSFQSNLRTIVPVSLGINRASLAWEQLCQCHLGTNFPVSRRNNCASVTWEELCQCYKDQQCQFHLETILLVQFGKKSKLI